MPLPPALRSTLALGLLCIAASAKAAEAESLPTGDSSRVRDRMTGWTAPPPDPVFVPPQPAPVTPAASLPRLSSGFGARVDPINGSRRVHTGLDMPGRAGTQILAAAPGTIAFAGRAGGYGQMVEIDHGGGLRTRYAHLSHILVRPGEAVTLQQTIALMGSTGRSTGNHLHFEVRMNGRATDPLGWFGGGPAPRSAATPPPALPAAPHVSDFARRRAATGAD